MDIFEEEIRPKSVLKDLNRQELRDLAKPDEVTTEFGSPSYITKVRSRSARFTEIIYNKPTKEQEKLLRQVLDYIKTKELIMVERTMCQLTDAKLKCRFYVTKGFARNAFAWYETLFPGEKGETNTPDRRADITVVSVPEWPERKVLVNPMTRKTYILGSDYTGEVKKAFLRLGMWVAKKQGWLGFHAGSKELIIFNKDGRLTEKGILLFGLSGTGKTTLTCHHHFLTGEETVKIRQDDVVFLKDDGYCVGTEDNFYMKTEGLSPTQDPLLYKVATSPNAILENVWVDKESGKPDFTNYQLTSNGRAVVRRREMGFTDEEIDIPYIHIVIFIFRRGDIMPPVAKLTPEQGAAFFMLGESVETSAGDPSRAGKQKRVVGTNPFIIGPQEEEGNLFWSILKKREDIEVYVLNTGRVGGESGEKITVHDSANIIRHIAKGDISWKVDPDWHYLMPEYIPGMEINKFDFRQHYSAGEYKKRLEGLRNERINWLKKFKGLKEEIKNAIG